MNKKAQIKDPLSNLKQDLDKANNFIDYFLVCGVRPTICFDEALYEIDLNNNSIPPKLDLQPEILTKCPSFDKSLVNIDEGILSYCFPSKFRIIHSDTKPPIDLFSFILDNNFFSIEYPQKYVTCLCFYEQIASYKTLKDKINKMKSKKEQSNNSNYCNPFNPLSQSVILPEMDKMSELTTKSSDLRSSNMFTTKSTTSNSLQSKYKNFYIPKAICLVSIYPFRNQHQNILKSIYKYAFSARQSKPIEKMILNLIIEIPVPPRGVSSVEYQLGNEKMLLERREFNKLPSVDFEIEIIGSIFNSEQILTIFKHLLLETKIIFFSKKIDNLFNMILGFLYLLYPFRYPFQVASYVQEQNFAIIESISPYILGIKQTYTDDFFIANNIEMSEMSILIVDIDNANIVLKSTESYPMLPKSFAHKLDKELQSQIALVKDRKKDTSSSSFSEGFCSCFFNFIVNVMKNYSKYLNIDYYTSNDNIQNTNISTLFKGSEFVQSFSSCDQSFIEKFVNDAQMFSDFIYKRMIPKDNKEKLEILFLDENITDNRRTIFHKKERIFIYSDSYAIKSCYIAVKAQNLNKAETLSLLNEDNRLKSLEYGQDVIVSSNSQILFSYILFPVFNNEIFSTEASLSDYNLPPCLNEEVEAINTDIVSKSNLSSIKVQNFEMENYIYLNWLQLWAFSFGYSEEKEEDYRFEQMVMILDKVTHHEMEVFNLIFEALKKKEKTQMIIRLYQKLIIYKINPSSYIYSIIYKLIDKNQIKSLTLNPQSNTENVDKESKTIYVTRRTINSCTVEDGVIGDKVKFYTNYICIQCQSIINLAAISKDFVNMKRDIMWAYCPSCDECILPKLKIRFGLEYNITPTIEGQTSTVDEVVLHSPYHLKINVKEGLFREYGILLDIGKFKRKFTPLFWNSIWYFYLMGLDYSFMLPYVKNRRKPWCSTTKSKKVKYIEMELTPKEKTISKRERYTELEISTTNEENSFELTNRIIRVIGNSSSSSSNEEGNEYLVTMQTMNILDNTLLPSDTASRLSEDDYDMVLINKLRRDSLGLGKIEEEIEDNGELIKDKMKSCDKKALTPLGSTEKIIGLFDSGQDFELPLTSIKHFSKTYEHKDYHEKEAKEEQEQEENDNNDNSLHHNEEKNNDQK